MSQKQQQQQQQQKNEMLDQEVTSLLNVASPSSTSLTGNLSSLDRETFAIPILYIVSTAISMLVMQIWQAFFTTQFKKIGIDVLDGTLLSTVVCTTALFLLSILVRRLVLWAAKRAVLAEPTRDWED
jgi:hypothetical protein